MSNDGSAFPTTDKTQGGMTLRDYFAAKVMAQFCRIDETIDPQSMDYKLMAKYAYDAADAMLDAREKP